MMCIISFSNLIHQSYSDGPSISASATTSDQTYTNPTFSFEILGGIGQKAYMPSVEFHVGSLEHDSTGHKKRITIDISSCILTPQLDLRLPGCLSALELSNVKSLQQVAAVCR
jgi:hypothetical protein